MRPRSRPRRRFSRVTSAGDFMSGLLTARIIWIMVVVFCVGFFLPEIGRFSEKHKKFRYLPEMILIAYGVVYVYLTFLSRNEIDVPYATGIELRPLSALRRAIRGHSVIPARGILLNILLYIPMGYLIPFVFRGMRKRSSADVILICLLISILTEILQLVLKVGWLDADDIINNTIGAAIGILIWRSRSR